MSQIPSLLVTHTAIVTADQIDELGHMNVRWYGHSARAATSAMAERLGLEPPTILNAYTRHHHEQLEGAALEVRSAVLGGHNRVRFYHELRNRSDATSPDGEFNGESLAATFVHEIDHPSLEIPTIEMPDYGRPRSLDLDVDRLAGAPKLSDLVSRGLAARLERSVTEADLHPNDLFWAGERPGGEQSWIIETADGDRVASATMESRIWLPAFPKQGTRIQSFLANVHVGDKITHELGWIFDLDREVPIAAYEGIDLAFSITKRASIVMPPQVRERELGILHPDLAQL